MSKTDAILFSPDATPRDEDLPWPLRRDDFAMLGERTTVIPIFAYRHATPRLVYADQPKFTESNWAFQRSQVFLFSELTFDCADVSLDKQILKLDVGNPYLIIRMPMTLMDELRGREYLGFVVAHSEIKSYIG